MTARYLANTNTKEIHDLEANITPSMRRLCKLDEIKKEHKRPIFTEGGVQIKIKLAEYTGCKWCLKNITRLIIEQ